MCVRSSLDDFSAMSPPAHDESFFYIRFPMGKKNGPEPPASVVTTKASNITDGGGDGGLNSNVFASSVRSPVHFHEWETGLPPAGQGHVDLSQECKKYLSGLENGESTVLRWSYSFLLCQ